MRCISRLCWVGLCVLSLWSCVERRSDSSGDGGSDNNQEAGPQERVVDLNRCQSGGGRLSETQCNKFWDCNNTDIFEEEVDLFAITCNDTTCWCEVSDEEIASFTLEEPTELCGVFSEPEFARRVMERCNFPDGPEMDEGTNNDTNNGTNNDTNNQQEQPVLEGLEAAPVFVCEEESYRLDALYYGEVASATLLVAWTDSPLDDGLDASFVWGEVHPVDVTDMSTEEQPATMASLSLQTNLNYRPGRVSLIDCAGWSTQVTVVLRLEGANGQPLTCAAWGHDLEGLLGGDYEFGLSIQDEEAQAVLEGCSFEVF